MDILPVITSASLIVVGAIVGAIPTLLNEKRKERHALRVRWDAPLYELCKEYVAVVRQFVHMVARIDRHGSDGEYVRQIDELHARLRSLSKQIFLLGDRAVQESAREIEHHAYWVRRTAEGGNDERLSHYHNVAARDRLDIEMTRFYQSARSQLGVSMPSDVAPDADISRRADVDRRAVREE
jgi:hypothetical protein